MEIKYAFWNNKGGTGKTSLIFQTIVRYAEKHPNKRILAIDVCPQANLSELMLGGLNNKGSDKLLQLQNNAPRCSIGGYFQLRLPSPYSVPTFNTGEFITTPNKYNNGVAKNIDLLSGDPLLELQSNAINSLANTNIPGTDTWICVIDWLNDFLEKVKDKYDIVFIDCNPSFSMFTQIALATTDRIILPVMADDSSRRAIQNAFSLIYGLKLPSAIYATYAFGTKLVNAKKYNSNDPNEKRKLPKVHLIAKNRITQYMGSASAYRAVLNTIESDIKSLFREYPDFFSFTDSVNGFIEIRDFQTTGVIAFAKGLPFSKVQVGLQSIGKHRVQVKEEYLNNCKKSMDELVSKL